MKKIVFVLNALPFVCIAQTAVKVYGNVNTTNSNNYYNTSTPIYNVQNSYRSFFSLWSVAVNRQLRKNKFVEIELGNFVSRQDNYVNYPVINQDSVYRISVSTNAKSAACRLEFGKLLLGDAKPKNWSLLLAHSLQGNYTYDEFRPKSIAYPITVSKWMLKYAIVPHINYMLNKHIGIDVNTPIQPLQFGIISQHLQNPSLALGQQKWTTLDFDALNKSNFISLRCGIIYKI